QYLHGFTYSIGTSFRRVVRWPWVLFHILAILISIPIIVYGLDWSYFLFFQKYRFLQIFLFPAVPIGALVPLMLPPAIYLYGKKENIPYLQPLAYALTQAAVLGAIWSSIYKGLTGRTGPEIFEEFEGDYSMEFAFGFLRKGVFDGWPSAHTSIAWSLAVVFFCYRPELSEKNKILLDNSPKFLRYRKFGFLYAIYIGFGVSTNIHWLSDAVAGVLIGITVGLAVSRTFSIEWEEGNQEHFMSVSKIYWVFFIVFLLLLFSVFGLDDLFR
ncbi:MAG: phosphatase PAP2 family protein, partial [Candidatus Heimdallarchaeota archaeon]|nr:phosphatase PAP2 family protein [Candidatus Heimdallarchaeota archaeon]